MPLGYLPPFLKIDYVMSKKYASLQQKPKAGKLACELRESNAVEVVFIKFKNQRNC
ncbi:hypothetical protein ASZ90_019881 [hydrocarbon metagenome]|uniref:Uncharacterized protein n=1 Tax=hydrocarbon metagenome TaxID=938273 RepID=A0A0W8E2P5_9ZZZZ